MRRAGGDVQSIIGGPSAFHRIAIVADTEAPTPPCGACRQILWEFGGDLEILLANLTEQKGTIASRTCCRCLSTRDSSEMHEIDNSQLTIDKDETVDSSHMLPTIARENERS